MDTFALPGQRPGRVAAEMVSHPPGVPAELPGERLNEAVVTYLRPGKDAGTTIPAAAELELKTFRVARSDHDGAP